MRGKATVLDLAAAGNRITPAYAGKSDFVYNENFNFQDHPRLCGEKNQGNLCFLWIRGSPPPMRGKVSGELLDINQYGITPAYAGKSNGVKFTKK